MEAIKEKVIEMLDYSENMADVYEEKGDLHKHSYWIGKVNAYQNVEGYDIDSKKAFFFCMDIFNRWICARIGKRFGVVFASNFDEAKCIALNEYGSDDACLLWVDEVSADGYEFTIYRSEI